MNESEERKKTWAEEECPEAVTDGGSLSELANVLHLLRGNFVRTL